MSTSRRAATTIAFPEKVDHSVRYDGGWRNGRPVEDPEKTKSWGFVTAKPSEYLIHMRRGKVRPRTSGQGASCFKMPWDSVAIIPTTITQLQFTADQVTKEKVGVEITGLAVYRITDPEMTFKMLNFSFAERAHEKLECTLREMFMGSVRRIVANMTVEDTLTKRKEGLAEEIMREIQPIVSGRGRENDKANRGWGVVIDTIEIQDVRVLSETVFANMQAMFRNELLLKARTAELDTVKEIAEKETRNAKEIAETKITAEASTRELKAKAESKAAEIEVAEAMKREKLRAEAERQKIAENARIMAERALTEQLAELAKVERERQVALAAQDRDRDAMLAELGRVQAVVEGERKVEDTRHLATREAAEHQAELDQWATQAKIELERTQVDAFLERQRQETEAKALVRERELTIERLSGETSNALAMGAKQVENFVSDESLRRDLVLTTMPAIAHAFAQNFGEMRFLQIGGENGGSGGAGPLDFITRAFAQVLEVAQASGLDLGNITRKNSPAPTPKE